MNSWYFSCSSSTTQLWRTCRMFSNVCTESLIFSNSFVSIEDGTLHIRFITLRTLYIRCLLSSQMNHIHLFIKVKCYWFFLLGKQVEGDCSVNSNATLGSHLTRALILRAAPFFVLTLNRTGFQVMLHRRVLGHRMPKLSPQLYKLHLRIERNKGCVTLWPCHLHF